MDLENKTICQLKELAKERGISGFSKLRKPELISLLTAKSNRSGSRSPKKKYFVNYLSGNETVAELKKIAKSTKMKMIPNMNKKQLSMVVKLFNLFLERDFPRDMIRNFFKGMDLLYEFDIIGEPGINLSYEYDSNIPTKMIGDAINIINKNQMEDVYQLKEKILNRYDKYLEPMSGNAVELFMDILGSAWE